MKRVQLTPNLFLDEYIPKDAYLKYQNKPHILISLLDDRLIKSDQMLRDKFGPITINNWWVGGDRNWSGLRTTDSPYYSMTSQHSYGRASDKLFKVSSQEVREYIKQNWKQLGITRIEDNVSWVHSDVGFTQLDTLLIFAP